MLLQHLTSKQYALLPSGVLIVEPHPGLLAARVLLLSAADYYVGLSDREQPRVHESGVVVVLAVLSHTLGKHGLPAVAKNIRTCWPRASILIFGDVALDLEAALYMRSSIIAHGLKLFLLQGVPVRYRRRQKGRERICLAWSAYPQWSGRGTRVAHYEFLARKRDSRRKSSMTHLDARGITLEV
jgi:hypothetical protein